MIFTQPPEDITQWNPDICIVGSGVVALAIINELRHTGKRILILEKGGSELISERMNWKECEISGHPFYGHITGRAQCFGGTSRTWGGQALPLDVSDISARPWVDLRRWPLSYEELFSYYKVADTFLNVSDIDYDTMPHRMAQGMPNGFDENALKYHFSKWSPKPDLSRQYRKYIEKSDNIRLIENTAALELILSNDRTQINGIKYCCTTSFKRGFLRAGRYVICMGGLENARLLLCSNAITPAGVGNNSGLVGKYFQDHPTAQVATVIAANDRMLQRRFNYFFEGTTRLLPRLSLTAALQEEKSVLAATSFIQFIAPEDSLFYQCKKIAQAFHRRHLPERRVVTDFFKRLNQFPSVLESGMTLMRYRQVYTPDADARLTVMIEQKPSLESKVELLEEQDTLGMPKLKICWQIPNDTVKTFRVLCETIENQFNTAGIGTLQWDQWVNGSDAEVAQNLIDAYHHMGTTRMSLDPSMGVVDPDCRVHGISNLYVLGTSVFPTSGHSNPTLTAIAIALRCTKLHLAA